MYLIGIEAFLAVVESGSISKAAALLHISQSSVSYRLKTLEAELGYKLLERNQGVRGIILTNKGHRYLSVAEKLMVLKRETESIQKVVDKMEIRFGVADSISLFVLPKIYKHIFETFQEAKPFILTQHTLETYESVKARTIDMGFVKSEFSMPNVIVKKCLEEEMILVRYGEPSQYLKRVDPSELNSKNEIYMDWGYAYQIWHDCWWAPNDYLVRVDAAHLVFELLDSEEKWAVVPRSIFDALAPTGPFTAQEITEKPPKRSCYLIYNKLMDPFKQAVLNEILDYFT